MDRSATARGFSRKRPRRAIGYVIAIRSLGRLCEASEGNGHQTSALGAAPWQRAYIERVIGTLRRECLNHVITKLRRLLSSESHAPGLAEGHARAYRSNHQTQGGLLQSPRRAG